MQMVAKYWNELPHAVLEAPSPPSPALPHQEMQWSVLDLFGASIFLPEQGFMG